MSGTVRLAVLITCHNRSQTTINCLERLDALSTAIRERVDVAVFLVDDGSTDGTGDRVRRQFPRVQVTEGTGSLYWAGGMRLAFATSLEGGRPYDGYLLVNDDVQLDVAQAVGFVECWLSERSRAENFILVGATSDQRVQLSYSGFLSTSTLRPFAFDRVAPVRGTLKKCDTFNANFVLLPGYWFRARGGLDPAFGHGLADIDLGLDALKQGIRSWVYGEYVGVCERGPTREVLLLRKPRRERAALLFRHPYGIRPEMHFVRKHKPIWLLPAYLARGMIYRVSLVCRKRRL